jgi:uncharacterized membrane protein YphA (DoxX/SURF4 family)
MAAVVVAQERLDGWIVRHAGDLKNALRIVFGIIWIIDGTFKFYYNYSNQFATDVGIAASGQPAWLAGWFSFWQTQANGDPHLWVYMAGTFELLLGLALIFGFMRKIAYSLGIVLSMFIWAVPEGFGGAYGPGSTDIGTGIVYAVVMVLLIILEATYGPTRLSLDMWLEQRWPSWARVAEFKGFERGPLTAPP